MPTLCKVDGFTGAVGAPILKYLNRMRMHLGLIVASGQGSEQVNSTSNRATGGLDTLQVYQRILPEPPPPRSNHYSTVI